MGAWGEGAAVFQRERSGLVAGPALGFRLCGLAFSTPNSRSLDNCPWASINQTESAREREPMAWGKLAAERLQEGAAHALPTRSPHAHCAGHRRAKTRRKVGPAFHLGSPEDSGTPPKVKGQWQSERHPLASPRSVQGTHTPWKPTRNFPRSSNPVECFGVTMQKNLSLH